MSTTTLLLISVLYALSAADLAYRGIWAMAGVLIAYAIANVLLVVALK